MKQNHEKGDSRLKRMAARLGRSLEVGKAVQISREEIKRGKFGSFPVQRKRKEVTLSATVEEIEQPA